MDIPFYLNRIKTSSFAKNVAFTYSTRIVVMALGLVTTMIVARILGPAGRGQLVIAFAVANLGIELAMLGLNSSNIYYVSKDRSLLAPLLSNGLFAAALLGGLAIFLFSLVRTFFPATLPLDSFVLLMALIWIPFGLNYAYLQCLLLGTEQVPKYNKAELILKSLILLGVLSLYFTQSVSLLKILVAYVVPIGLMNLILVRSFRVRITSFSMNLFSKVYKYGFKTYLNGLFAFLIIKVDLFMVRYLTDDTQTGFYSVASTTGDLLLVLPLTVVTVLFPKLSSEKDKNSRWNKTIKSALVVTGIMVGACLLIYCLTQIYIQIVFGAEFLAAAEAVQWLLPGILFMSLYLVFNIFLGASGQPYQTIWASFTAVVINIVANLFLIERHGIVGASMASTISYGVLFLLSLTLAQLMRRGFIQVRE